MYIFLYVCRFDNSYNDYLQILFLLSSATSILTVKLS